MNVVVVNLPYLMLGPFPDGRLGGLALTLWLALLMGAASLAIGIVLASAGLAGAAPLRILARSIVLVIRGVPSLVFLFWIYFLLPRVVGIDIPALESAVVALALYHGAYMSEDIRGGFRAVPAGQWEASRALGLGPLRTLRLVVLPQAVRAVVPSLINRFVNLLLYTSVVSIVGVLEFTRAAVLVSNRELIHPMEIFGFVGFVYFALCWLLSRAGRRLERKWSWAPRIGTVPTAL